MKNSAIKNGFMIATTLLGLTCAVGAVYASGHFISGLQGKYPAYDLNDTYVFQSSSKGYTSFISSSNPSQPGTGTSPTGTVFGQDGLYNLHFAQDTEFKNGMTLVFSFEKGKVSISKINIPNAETGEKGEQLGNGQVGEKVSLSNGMRIWVGRGDDPFFGNGVGLAKFNTAKQKGTFSPEVFKEDGDLFIGATASFIVVDVPNKMLGNEVKFFTTTSVLHKGEWRQVDRHANVLFPYVFLSDTPAVHEDHGQHRPDLDVAERRQTIIHNVFWASSVAGAKPTVAKNHAYKVADMVMPDVMTYQIGTKASYAVNGLNGRALHDDAMNTVLELMTGVEIDDNANNKMRYKTQFPYIISNE